MTELLLPTLYQLPHLERRFLGNFPFAQFENVDKSNLNLRSNRNRKEIRTNDSAAGDAVIDHVVFRRKAIQVTNFEILQGSEHFTIVVRHNLLLPALHFHYRKLFEIPACRGREVLSLLIELDLIPGKESEQYPDSYPKEYRERVEIFSRNYIWRKITGDITIAFLEAAVDRMFTADEVSGVVDLAKLKELAKHI